MLTGMVDRSDVNVTEILAAARAGDRSAVERILPAVYDELRERAASYLRRERPGHTLQPTALVHEAYMRLVDQDRIDWRGRAHFLAAASETMRRVLVDHARTRKRHKRGGGAFQVTLDEEVAGAEERDFDVLAVHEALERLAAVDERQARVVELRFFGGMNLDEIAEVLAISPRTAWGEWRHARAWLTAELARRVGE
jgi:RNA polymerase sigma-70 factor (ECF subfamily)